jgi:hypothetical protein
MAIENTMVNIVSKQTKNNNVEICIKDAQYYYLPFDKNELNFKDEKIKDSFIKSVERRVRNSKLYKAYIDYLKTDLKLNRCAIFGNIESDKNSKTKIEMHHGPIFTLYDYVNIVLNKNLIEKNYEKINTFDIAAEVLDLHKRKLVQTVMLCETAHATMKNPKLAPFLSQEKAFGNIYEFIKEYHKYFTTKNIYDLKTYFTKSKEIDSSNLNMLEPALIEYNILKQKEGLEYKK